MTLLAPTFDGLVVDLSTHPDLSVHHDDEPGTRPGRTGFLARLRTETALTFLFAFAVYLAGGIWVSAEGIFVGDAISRVGNANFVLWSRTPHLAAVGFVWNPLPSILELPFVAFRPLAHDWVAHNGPAYCVSAIMMAGNVALLSGCLREMTVRPGVRRLMTLIFAFQPLIWFYGSNGMSEAMQVFFLLLAGRHVARWLRDAEATRSLVIAGIALGLGYLTRYEVLAAGAATVTLVVLVSFLRNRRRPTYRRNQISLEGLLIGLPFAACVLVLITTSKIIVKAWFPTLTSEYGNKALIEASVAGGGSAVGPNVDNTLPSLLGFIAHQMVLLEPLALVAAVLTGIVMLRRRDGSMLAYVSTLGGVLLFDTLATASGSTYGWLRFNITLIPLTFLLAGYLAGNTSAATSRYVPTRSKRLPGLVALVLVLAGTWSSIQGVADEKYDRIDAGYWRYLFNGHQVDGNMVNSMDQSRVEADIATTMDRMKLPDGSILIEAAQGFLTLLDTNYPDRWVTTPDLDFEKSVADPYVFGIKYILTTGNTAGYDPVDQRFPGFFDNGGGWASLQHEWKIRGGATWRLFKVTGMAPGG